MGGARHDTIAASCCELIEAFAETTKECYGSGKYVRQQASLVPEVGRRSSHMWQSRLRSGEGWWTNMKVGGHGDPREWKVGQADEDRAEDKFIGRPSQGSHRPRSVCTKRPKACQPCSLGGRTSPSGRRER